MIYSIGIFSLRAFSATRNSITAVSEERLRWVLSFLMVALVVSEREYPVLVFLLAIGFLGMIKYANYSLILFYRKPMLGNSGTEKIKQHFYRSHTYSKKLAKTPIRTQWTQL
jgi:hypothetical protein